jgi:hypothetical protein
VTVCKRMTTGAVALAMTATFGIAGTATSASAAPHTPRAAAAQPATTLLPVTGTLPDGTAFTGQLSNLTTSVVNGVLQLSGTVTGTGLPAGGTTFTAPIQDVTTNTACDVLNLDLGPLHLDLLGLVVDLAPVHLDITAQPGPGKLLGNLLCAVAGLLDQSGGTGGALNGVSALLNRLLSGLGLA